MLPSKVKKLARGASRTLERLQDILRQHSTNNSANGRKLVNRRRDGLRPVRMVVEYDTKPNKGTTLTQRFLEGLRERHPC